MTISWVGSDFDLTFYASVDVPKYEKALKPAIYIRGDELGYTKDQVDRLRRPRRRNETEFEYFGRMHAYARISGEAQMRTAKIYLKEGARRRVERTLEQLSKDYDLYIITNGIVNYVEHALEALQISESIFKLIIGAGDIYNVRTSKFQRGVTGLKPDLRPFREAISFSRATPSEHAFIGDSDPMDIGPSLKAGMHPVKVGKKSAYRDVPTVHSIVEVRPAIRRFK